MQNLNPTVRKLQMALKQYVFIVSISSTQVHNSDKDLFVTITSVSHKGKLLFRSGNKIFVVKNLVEILNVCKTVYSRNNATRHTVLDVLEDEVKRLNFE